MTSDTTDRDGTDKASEHAIAILPEDLANQIAAGEVVERPASVVKELVENALDANAHRIRVDIAGGGVGLVRVADDGTGMSRADASLAVLRHATSKIARIDDLRNIRSFGFRGEALPSIASVSRFVLRTRLDADAEGTEIRIEGGGSIAMAPCGCAVGTSVEVRDLFFNVPARRKFLRGLNTETAHATDVIQAAALGQPGCAFVLAKEGRIAKEWLRAQNRAERVRGVIGGEELATCMGERGPLRVEAFVSRPERARSGAGWLWIFVNTRHVRDRSLARAIALAYGSVLEPGRYPVGAVYLDLPPDLVDVNVHPQKAEVRFADGRAVSDALYKIIAYQLSAAFGVPAPHGNPFQSNKNPLFEASPQPPSPAWIWSPGAAPQSDTPLSHPSSNGVSQGGAPQLHGSASGNKGSDPWGLGGDVPLTYGDIPPASGMIPIVRPADDTQQSLPVVPIPTAPSAAYPTADQIMAAAERAVVFGALRFIAQLRNMFLVCEGADGVYFLDQHAAAERVTFHKLRGGYDSREVAAQKLLFPVVVTATTSEVALVEEAQQAILRTGLDVRPAGATQLAVHAVPHLLVRASPAQLVRDLLDEIGHSGERAFSGAIDLALATMACHGSLRAGDPVSAEEACALLKSLDEVDFAGHCPHGRPIVMRISWFELEHRVGRR